MSNAGELILDFTDVGVDVVCLHVLLLDVLVMVGGDRLMLWLFMRV